MISKKTWIEAGKIVIFFALGLGIFAYVYRDQNFDELWSKIQNLHWGWVVLGIVLSLISHYSRAVRWQILIRSLGHKPRLMNTLFSVFIMYIANLAVPRLGEVSRCGVMKKYEGISFTQLLGTVFLERVIDFLMLFIATFLAFVLQGEALWNFLHANPEVSAKIDQVFSTRNMLILGALAVVASLALWWWISLRKSELGIMRKLNGFVEKFSEGLQTIWKMKEKGWFIFHSILIWVLYYLMLYVGFFAFDFSSHLGPEVGLVLFVLGSYGMVAPVQGGIGAWHFMVIQALLLYGVSRPDASVFALVVHASMTLLLMVTGAISLIMIPIYNSKQHAAE